jgi:large subunit ribosomal protein L4
MRIAVLNTNGQPTGREVELPDSIFNLEQPNDHAIYLAGKTLLGQSTPRNT